MINMNATLRSMLVCLGLIVMSLSAVAQEKRPSGTTIKTIPYSESFNIDMEDMRLSSQNLSEEEVEELQLLRASLEGQYYVRRKDRMKAALPLAIFWEIERLQSQHRIRLNCGEAMFIIVEPK